MRKLKNICVIGETDEGKWYQVAVNKEDLVPIRLFLIELFPNGIKMFDTQLEGITYDTLKEDK